jgi:hypothetical protein
MHTVANVLRTMILLVRSLLSDQKNPAQTIQLGWFCDSVWFVSGLLLDTSRYLRGRLMHTIFRDLHLLRLSLLLCDILGGVPDLAVVWSCMQEVLLLYFVRI